ncbi:MAG TPA: hypothetical protein VFF13_04790 [archaeon]|nr:hypothetical protein [archaeon]
MINVDKFSVAMLFVGAGLGSLIPGFPAPLDVLNPSITIVFLILGVIFLVLR